MDKKSHKEAYKIIKKARKVLILPHANSDGDCIGSAFGLKAALDAVGVKCDVLMEEGNDLLDVVDKGLACYEGQADLVISVDCADEERLGERKDIFQNCQNTICFDHHKTNESFAKLNIIEGTYGSCGEVIYDFCKVNKIKIDKAIAHNLFLGIASDTGGFRFSNVRVETHMIAAELMEKGANADDIMTALFSSSTMSRTMLMKLALETLKVRANGIATMEVTRKMIEEAGASEQETQSLVGIGRSIKGVKFSILLKEKEDGTIKISTRSNTDNIDAGEICKEFNNGGGHTRAAGAIAEGVTIEEAKEQIVKLVEQYV